MTTFNWGILGTGNIAGAMAAALDLVPGARLRAVASRQQATADRFARRWNTAHAHGSYDALLADPEVDIVYIATPNALHKANILAALEAGKHVLCEKPITTSPEDTDYCAEIARTKNLFLMEAMWTAFFPAMIRARELLRDGAIGEVRHLSANFVSYRDPHRHPNLFDPDLGGGATLDLGVYPMAAALLLAGPMDTFAASLVRGQTGVDEMVGVSASHRSGAMSQLAFGFRVEMPIAVRVTGDRGVLEIPDEFHHPERLVLRRGTAEENISLPALGHGYAHEAIEVQNCIAAGAIDSEIWPLHQSSRIARISERILHGFEIA